MSALGCESSYMKINITKIGAALLAIGICMWSTEVRAQTTTTVTTTKGAFTEYAPGSETMVVRTETSSAPLRYVVTKQTTIVDESGAPVAIERISPGSPLSIQYSGTGDHLVASRHYCAKAGHSNRARDNRPRRDPTGHDYKHDHDARSDP